LEVSARFTDEPARLACRQFLHWAGDRSLSHDVIQ